MNIKSIFICQSCGHQEGRWFGRCQDCNTWNSCAEEIASKKNAQPKNVLSESAVIPLTDIQTEHTVRRKTGFGELDRVLGGGLVSGAVILLGGEPGIGKSTLLLQIAAVLSAQTESSGPVLYCSGEESDKQIKLRADRLGLTDSHNLHIFSETCVSALEQAIRAVSPSLVIVDSIQSAYSEDLSSVPGSVSQVRECASRLTRQAKTNGFPLFFVGHVTKEGTLAGPGVLEHMVDTVLYFEGDNNHSYRILRSVKNRFGSTNEVGFFEMLPAGLAEVPDASKVLLSQRVEGTPGSAVTVMLEGSRPLLVEIQALCVRSYALPRRTTSGIDPNRLAMLLAVIEKRLGIPLGNQDVFVNVAGGLKITEPAADLAVCAAILSSIRDIPLNPTRVFFGEVGLGGEVRSVSGSEQRLREAFQLGFLGAVTPCTKKSCSTKFPNNLPDIFEIPDLRDADPVIFPSNECNSSPRLR